MWTQQILGVDSYHIIQWFFAYSILGWCVESIYMSICSRKLVNRGFVKGPICPIYGFGALGVYFLLRPISDDYVLLYICGALTATAFEFLVGKAMQILFGEIWWDYRDKPFNYKGIVCLESTVAWGFYTLIMFGFLQRAVEYIVDSYSYQKGVVIGTVLILFFAADLGHSLYEAKKEDLPYTAGEIKDVILSKLYQ